MDRNDIIGSLCSFCESKGIKFITGADYFQNIDLSVIELNIGDCILSVDLQNEKLVKNNRVYERAYTGIIRLGRKFEMLTQSELDENFYQKYINRLLELDNALEDYISMFVCQEELELRNYKVLVELNKFDECIDFVSAQVTIVQ